MNSIGEQIKLCACVRAAHLPLIKTLIEKIEGTVEWSIFPIYIFRRTGLPEPIYPRSLLGNSEGIFPTH